MNTARSTPALHHSLAQRLLATSFALLMTTATLGGIHQLASSEAEAGLLAQQQQQQAQRSARA